MDAKLDEMALSNLLRQRDETAFTQLVEQYHASLVRLACLFVQDDAIAEEISQETWLAVLQGLSHFEGRSSLKTWLFTILTNKAKPRSRRQNRSLVFSDFDDAFTSFEAAATVNPERFNNASAEERLDHWSTGSQPASRAGIPEDIFLSAETLNLIRQTIEGLPQNQRSVITLHDVEELSSQEICNILE